ncbi:hypothetical protein ACB092_07G129500 [Castanea dentata]
MGLCLYIIVFPNSDSESCRRFPSISYTIWLVRVRKPRKVTPHKTKPHLLCMFAFAGFKTRRNLMREAPYLLIWETIKPTKKTSLLLIHKTNERIMLLDWLC